MNNPFTTIALPEPPKEIKGLNEMALNLWRIWNLRGRNLFNFILKREHNPILMFINIKKGVNG